jgi:hypothetical protein
LAIDKTFNLLNDNYQICTIDTFRDNFNFWLLREIKRIRFKIIL